MLGDSLEEGRLHLLKLQKNSSLVEMLIYFLFSSLPLINHWPYHFFQKLIKCKKIVALSYQEGCGKLFFLLFKNLSQSSLVLGHYWGKHLQNLKSQFFYFFGENYLKKISQNLEHILGRISGQHIVINGGIFKICVLYDNISDHPVNAGVDLASVSIAQVGEPIFKVNVSNSESL